eukprot:TRINITY_DN15098_c0_g1_i1.p1 TRINITY_DN15098_c0_g1~~TRINITY_DN15098_c0_g1_i1.p1  ORF type:complete len:318 (-),score=31.55 TRINITY_DN15098_c0_g1_i1:25-978(-)
MARDFQHLSAIGLSIITRADEPALNSSIGVASSQINSSGHRQSSLTETQKRVNGLPVENDHVKRETGQQPSPPGAGKKKNKQPAGESLSKATEQCQPSQSDSAKMLMIHGCVQNASIFSSRTSNLRSKALKIPGKGKLDFVFAESPLPVHAALSSDDGDPDGRSWYTPKELLNGDSSVRPVHSKVYCEWHAPLEALRNVIEQQGPFVGMLAFSQGGVPATVMLSQMRSKFKFAIFVSCFAPLDPEVCAMLKDAEENPLNIPTMHVIGTEDPFVAEDRSRQLAKLFKDPVIVSHSGGHIMIPKDLFGNVKDFMARALA